MHLRNDCGKVKNISSTQRDHLVNLARETDGTPARKLVAVLAALGITGTAELSQVLGVTKRAIQKLHANHSSHPTNSSSLRTTVRTPANHSSHPSPLKKKGLPHTPSKEKIHPPPDSNVDRESPTSTESPSSSVVAAAPSKAVSPARRMIVESLAKWVNSSVPDERIANATLDQQLTLYGADVVKNAYAEVCAQLASGAEIRKPIVVMGMVCQRLAEAKLAPGLMGRGG